MSCINFLYLRAASIWVAARIIINWRQRFLAHEEIYTACKRMYTMNILKTLKRKLTLKISFMREKRRRRNGSVYPRIVPQRQIDLGEELTSLQESLTISSSLTSLGSDEQPPKEEIPFVATDEGFCDSSQPKLWPVDMRSNVQLVELRLTADSKLSGRVMVANLAHHKNIFVRWTANNWASYQDTVASHDDSSERLSHDWFTFTIDSDSVCKDTNGGVCVELAVAYQVNGMEFWDNNGGDNFGLLLNS